MATVIDPCFPRSLGEANGRRSLIDTKTKILLQGNHVDQLRVNDFYVIYGTLAPVQADDKSYRVMIPRCSSSAGISRMLGAKIPWDLPPRDNSCHQVAVSELFCGGIGGWSQACRRTDSFRVVMALDSDPGATKWFVANNGGCHCLHGDYYKSDIDTLGFPVYTCDVADKAWYQTFLQVECDMFTISFPCTPWSSMGAQSGLMSESGRALLEVLESARILQPAVLAFENVPGFRSSREFPLFIEQLKLAGYQVMYAAVDDLASYTCVARRRWIAVAINTLHLHKPQLGQAWARPLIKVPSSFDPARHSVQFADEVQALLWEPTDHEKAVLRQYPNRDGAGIPDSRVVSAGSVLPTYTASYRKSVDFSPSFLRSKGLHAWMIRDLRERVRWLSATEAAVLMGVPLDVQLPADVTHAVHLVGNAIAPAHAALALHYAGRMLNEQTGAQINVEFADVLSNLGGLPVDFRDMVLVVRDATSFLCQKREMTRKRARVSADKPSATPSSERMSRAPVSQDVPNTLVDTQPFPDVVKGHCFDGSPSGFDDSFGKFCAMQLITQPCSWRTWLQHSPVAKDIHKYGASFQETFLNDSHVLLPGFKYVLQLHKLVPGGPGSVSGVYDVKGDFRCLPTPIAPVLWKQWLADNNVKLPESVWVTADNMVLNDMHVLCACKSQILRFRARLKGGASKIAVKTHVCTPDEVRCGFLRSPICVGLDGRLINLPPLCPGMTWQEWIRPALLPEAASLWATIDGNAIDATAPLPGGPFVLRLRARLRAGTKKTHHDADVQKLTQHLVNKGVSESDVKARVQAILEHVTPEQLSAVYKALEPWVMLKQFVGMKVRMVEPREMRAAKSKTSSVNKPKNDDEAPEDPWLFSDPWSQAKHEDQHNIQLLPEYFIKQDGNPPDLLPELKHEACGVSLTSLASLEALVSTGTKLSSRECAAICLAPRKPEVSPFVAEEISFVAMHSSAGKILLRGYLVNLGELHISLKKLDNAVHFAEQKAVVVTIEIVRKCVPDWSLVSGNPMKHAWNHIDRLQRSLLASWTRKFFLNRKPSSATDATTWHAFGKVLHADMEYLLRSSGSGGVFISPKDDAGGPSGEFRVVWTEETDCEKLRTIAKAQPGILGLVHGRTNYGYRVRVSEYAKLRTQLDPSWQREEVKYEVIIRKKFILTPLPLDVDRGMLQRILDQVNWLAVPIRQLGPASWLVGSSDLPPGETIAFRDRLVLISPEPSKTTNKAAESAVLAAPLAIRRALDRQISSGSHSWENKFVASSATTGSIPVAPHPAPDMVSRSELESKINTLQEQVNQAICNMEQKVATTLEASSSAQSRALETVTTALQSSDERISKVENEVQTMAQAICTKTDLTSILSEALAKQSQDFQRLMAKRPGDPSPSSEANKLSKQS